MQKRDKWGKARDQREKSERRRGSEKERAQGGGALSLYGKYQAQKAHEAEDAKPKEVYELPGKDGEEVR